MSKLSVVISAYAQEQIEQQVLYIARDSIDNALAWEARLRAAIADLAKTPGHAIDEEASERTGEFIRKMVFEGTYLIQYRVDKANRRVEVLNFRHGARLPKRGGP